MNINKMLYLLTQAKNRGLKEIAMWFDTEAKKFNYHMAKVGSMYLEKDYMKDGPLDEQSLCINLHEEDDKPSRFPHDPRLEPGGIDKSGWGFWNKDYTEWFGPWDDIRDAEKCMAIYDKEQESKRPDCPVFGDIGIVENNISAAIRDGMGECWKKYPHILAHLQNAEKEIEAFWKNRAIEEKDSPPKKDM